MDDKKEVTLLLNAIKDGEPDAKEKLYDRVYTELKNIAKAKMSKERVGHTLQATALVNEAHLKLMEDGGGSFENRAHFFGAAARAMKCILIDHARNKNRLKKGGDFNRVPLHDDIAKNPTDEIDLIALNDVLEKLGSFDERKKKVVEFKYFLGLTVNEIAEILKISPRTVNDDWDFSKSWLHRELSRN